MANKRHAKFPSKGAPLVPSGPKQDSVGPIKTMNWPGVPGPTKKSDFSNGFKKAKNGAASEGV